MKNLHDKLISSGGWYARWHQDSVHHIVHWSGFLFVAIVAAFIFQNSFAHAPGSVQPIGAVIMPAGGGGNGGDVLQLTAKMLNSNDEHRSNGSEKASPAYSTLLDTAKQRRKVLASLITTNPKAALEATVNDTQKGDFEPEIADLMEHKVKIEGMVQEMITDNIEQNKTQHRYFLKDAKSGQSYELYFAKPQTQVLGGKKINVEGVELDKNIAVSKTQVLTTTSKSLATISGPPAAKKTAVILMNFRNDSSQPFTKTDAKATVFGATSASVRSFYAENSYGQIDIQGKIAVDGDVYGWYTIPHDNTECIDQSRWGATLSAWATDADTAAAGDGFDRAGYDITMYAFPQTANCNFQGATFNGTPFVFINGTPKQTVTSHEFGHTFRLLHASGFLCYDDVGNKVTLSNRCNIWQYADPFDVMGAGWVHHYNSRYKGQTGFSAPNYIPPENKTEVTTSGTYVIQPIEKAGTGIMSLSIPRAFTYYDDFSVLQTVTDGAFFVEYRQPIGYDNFPPTDPVVNGVSIRLANAYSGLFHASLLDMNPSTSTFNDAPLALGKTFIDKDKGISISLLSLDANGATVRVNIPSTTCVPANPSVSIVPSSQSGAAGKTLSYTMTVTNNDSNPCTPATFDLTPTLPANWIQTPDTMSEVITPGNSVVKTILVTAPADAVAGTYTFTETSHNVAMPTLSGSANAAYVIPQPQGDGQPPVVSITNPADKTVYTSDVTVKVTATASDADGIKTIQLAVDTKILGTCTGVTTCVQNLLTKTLTIGTHTITATATDKSGMKNTATITITKQKPVKGRSKQ